MVFIAFFFAINFFFRALVTFPAAYIVAFIGPKHTNLLSNILYVPALLFLFLVPDMGIPALAGAIFFQTISICLYDLAHIVNFSKVRHLDHSGKELGYMYTIERIAVSLSPVVGGLVAFYISPQATIILAAVILGFAALPLFFTPEPTKTHQQITWRHFRWALTRPGMIAHMAIGADFVASTSMWSLYIAIGILGVTDNAIYAQIGALFSVTVIASLIFARIYGNLIDKHRGGELLKVGVLLNSLVHLLRPLVSTPVQVVVTNIANEAGTTAQAMPFTKGMFDTADSLPGYRIVYMALMQVAVVLGASLFWLMIALIGMHTNEVSTMQIGYVIMAFIALLVLRHGFSALSKTH